MWNLRKVGLLTAILAMAVLSACGQAAEYQEAVDDEVAIVTPAPLPTPAPTPSPVPSPTPVPSPEPTPTPLPAIYESLAPIGQTISAGGHNNFAIREDGSLWGWGLNIIGGLGDGTTERRDEPVHILDNVVSVAASWGHAHAIRTDGSLWAWGGANLPAHALDDVVYAGGSYAIRTDGNLWRWGSHIEPERIMDNVIAVSVGGGHTMAIQADGSLWGWGWNWYGQIGDGTTEDRDSPVHIMDDVIAVSVGGFHTAAITSDGALWTWGNNSTGHIGDGTTTIIGEGWTVIEDNTRLYPVRIMDDVIAVSASEAPVYGESGNTLAIRSDESLWGWGFGMNSGPIPYHRNTWHWYNPVPGKIMDNVANITRDIETAMVITDNGDLWDLSNGAFFITNDVAGAARDFDRLLTLHTDGSLYSWERNSEGVLDGDVVVEWLNPVRVMDGVLLP